MQNVKMSTQATAESEFQDLPKKKPATREEEKCAHKAVEFAVSCRLA